MEINIEELRLKLFLKLYKKSCDDLGIYEYAIYPNFCILLSQGKITFNLPKERILELACIILIEGV